MTHTVALDLDLDVEQRIQRVASIDVDVLITGPTGSGKSVVARRIHELSALRDKPFFAQNCAAIPVELAESTLFGHERGAFTNAHQPAKGIVEAADKGTLFLDEIGELPLAVQAKLLTLLQERVYRPLGSTQKRTASFRLIAATNRDLVEQCNRGLFRDDLYHRINGLSIALRPLSETPERAQRIASEKVKQLKYPQELGAQVLSAVKRLTAQPSAWPGNIRELQAFVQRCYLGVEEEENRTIGEWVRWQRSEGTERLTAIASSTSPSLDDRQQYAELIHKLATPGARPSAAFSRKGSLDLASRLLDTFPEPVSQEDVQEVLGVRDPRSVKTNIKLLVTHGLAQPSQGGIVARWPPATSTVFRLHRSGWIPAGPGEIMSLAHGARIRIELTSKVAGRLGVMLITHKPGGSMVSAVLIDGKELFASKPMVIEIELDGAGGLEQLLLHVAPVGHRGGRLVEPTHTDGLMPDSAALERGRRMVLDRWHEGWLAEHLVFHMQGD